ncbi:unnamed protein product [Amoebophrya sp. A25]|nr:unnamed protein product [Amoebophrya sp. A25]|eukprot:GSA25T00010984001.1
MRIDVVLVPQAHESFYYITPIQPQPLSLLLEGNPPFQKEFLIESSISFSRKLLVIWCFSLGLKYHFFRLFRYHSSTNGIVEFVLHIQTPLVHSSHQVPTT